MRARKMIYLGIAVFVGAATYFGWKSTARGAYESAEYKVVETDGSFEIREYPELLLVTTRSEFAAKADDGSFMRLFRYISGSNDAEQKVAMTTPVFMEPDAGKTPGQMGFVIPKKIAEQGAPTPKGENVRLQKRTGGRFAVIRFPGRMTRETTDAAEAKLREWIAGRGLEAAEKAEFAGYDPPWTPGPMRRNEILIRLLGAEEKASPEEETLPRSEPGGTKQDARD
ncbi:SOUL family heme-binding protein [Lignipirellula cremea]|uniref:SOUL heme-binding protein n=1 Tax=Lignipirellula cremea TaxID=2528010 RepID=A0A518DKW2_9BACT|nr:heme-binding protein [Lignipirellula cremea]QDU92466.1 SOUL heme-binding protein [Lignipirellula cremea]